MELLDTSAWHLKDHSHVRSWFGAALLLNQIATCELVAIELLHVASTRRQNTDLHRDLRRLPWMQMGSWEWKRIMEVYDLLDDYGGSNLRRSVKHADLLIAACAERYEIALVHYDQDFDAIQQVTGQPMRWILPSGTV